MKRLLLFLFWLIPSISFAYPATILGGKRMEYGMAHSVSVGWPSVSYEWWNAGRPDWALGAEIVYGDWSGEYSDVTIGLGVNVPLKWQIVERGRVGVGFKFQPGILIAGGDSAPRTDTPFVFGIRGELGAPISIGVHPQVNIITGLSVPFSMFVVEHADNPSFVIPLLPRVGAEFLPDGKISVWILAEVGPTIGIASGHVDVKPGVRAMLGATFW